VGVLCVTVATIQSHTVLWINATGSVRLRSIGTRNLHPHPLPPTSQALPTNLPQVNSPPLTTNRTIDNNRARKIRRNRLPRQLPQPPHLLTKTPSQTYFKLAWMVNSNLRKGSVIWTTSCASSVVSQGILSMTALPSLNSRVEQLLLPLLLRPQLLVAREKGEQPFVITVGGLR